MAEALVICGLGVQVPEETTLETLQALGDCRVVFSDLADAKAFAWLKGYCAVLRRSAKASEILAEARRGGVGLAVWGHPQFSSSLARRVQASARKAGLTFRVLGAISPVGSAFARTVSFLGGDYGYQGLQAYEVATLLEDPKAFTPELPLVLYAEQAKPEQWRAALKAVGRGYADGHEVRVFPRDGTSSTMTLAAARRLDLKGGLVFLAPKKP